MRDVVIVSAVRTPIGSFGGSLSSLTAMNLGVIAAKEAIKRAGIKPDDIQEVIVGNVLSAGLGQNVSRQILINLGISEKVSSMTINKLCGSGLRAISLAAGIIKLGEADIVLAGGTESMSNAPYLLPKVRWGVRMGNDTIVDSLLRDGLWDAFDSVHMGITAENIAEKWSISKREQDEFSLQSQHRAEKAIKDGKFKDEIVSVSIPQKKGDPQIVDIDEFPRYGVKLEDLEKLKPAFKKDGTVTAGNSSGINDGAAMVVLMSKEMSDKLGIKPMAAIKSYASAGVDPKIMGYGVVPASQKAMQLAGITAAQLNLIEANEAFASQAICVTRELGFSSDKTNVNGGAIALGHPIGATGARILITLLYEMNRRDAKTGLATLCIGGGMGTAMIVER